MPEMWWGQAKRDRLGDAGPFLPGPYRGVIHTTEGSSYAGARAAYVKHRSAPHFTVSVESGEFQAWQHTSLDRAARSMRNAPGGVQTNRLPCIQIEIVWRAALAHEMTDTLLDGLRELMAWVEDQVGIKPWAPPFVGSDEGYGTRSQSRMRPESWLAFDGWCGHQHVPENTHWDPGRIPIERLLERPSKREEVMVPPMYDPPIGPVAAVWQDEDGKVVAAASPDGDVYAWGCEWDGNVRGKPYWQDRRVARIGPPDRPEGTYTITATTGEKYTLPDGYD